MADRPICIGVKTNGQRCDKKTIVGHERCRTHINTVRNNGPNATAINELVYTHKRLIREVEVRWDQRINAEINPGRQDEMAEDMDIEKNMLKVQQRNELNILRRAQQEQIRQTGIDPDREANERRRADEARRNELHRQQWNNFNVAREVRNEQAALLAAAQRAQAAVQPQRELENFVNDNQNVHLAKTVEMVKKMVDRILVIPVPEGYRWNMNECSKTPGEIITECKLTPKAAWQMSAKYCQDEQIYEMEKGIYGKVLDSVWQYIVASADKPDLCRCLKQEMEDNIGMCAQGNLSRLCNILVGYLDGIEPKESISNILGRLLPKLMDIECLKERLDQAFKILKENEVNKDEWNNWIEPLLLDQDDLMDIRFVRNSQDEITGFVAVLL